MRDKKIKKRIKASKTAVDADAQKLELKRLKKKWRLGLAIAAFGIVIIVAALLWPNSGRNFSFDKNDKNAVIDDKCLANKTTTYGCYKKELTDITNKYSPEKAMAFIKQQYEKVPYVKTQCHQLTHVVGRTALSRYKNVADTYAHGDQFCWSGYYHGAMEQVADENGYDYIIKNANSICAPIAAKNKNSFYHYNCVHGLGHGLMFVKDGDLFASLKACDAIKDDWERTSCYGGVYMQNIMYAQSPDETDNRQSKYLRADEPMYPCTAVDYKYKSQCYLMQTSYALETVSYDFSKIFSLCSEIEEEFQNTCFTSIGRDASGSSVSNIQSTRSNCLLGPTETAQRYCVHGAAMDFVSYFHSDQQAKQLCESLPANLSADCLIVVKNYYATF